MERVLPIEVRVLADLLGPSSSAAKALRIIEQTPNPHVFREGRLLIITDALGDTTAFGPGPFIERCRARSADRDDTHLPHASTGRPKASDQV